MRTSTEVKFAGLSSEEAAKRQKLGGFNELPTARPKTLLLIAWSVMREPMFLLLIACASLYVVLGEMAESIGLAVAVLAIMLITFYQERKSERALEALKDLSSPRAIVIRDGQRQRIAGRDIVQDDLVVLNEGDRVPADGVVLESQGLLVDESLLTGESLAVRKRAMDIGDGYHADPGGEDRPEAFSGTLVVQGNGVLKVERIGIATAIGKIGRALETTVREKSPLQIETQQAIRTVAVISISLSVGLAAYFIWLHHEVLGGVLTGLTLAMAIIPEEFPVVLTVFMAMGAWRLAKKRVLTRQAMAIETLGETSILCVDKTGTLTQNRMSIATIKSFGGDISDANQDVLQTAELASQMQPVDPMEIAIVEANKMRLDRSRLELVKSFPLSKDLLCMSHVWRQLDREDLFVACKGAPEAVLSLCEMPDAEKQRVMSEVVTLAQQGLRVIAVAKTVDAVDISVSSQAQLKLSLLGLLGFLDPPREGVHESIRMCRDAGIRVVMITGDYPVTAASIAKKIGIESNGEVLTGAEVAQLSDVELEQALARISILARMVPEQKLRVVESFKHSGKIVAMTGDGVNDAPALKAAHIGVAMGGRGTDVAREAASLVLLDDDFESLVAAVRTGRRIFDNIQKAMAYIIAVHVPIAGMSVLPVLFGWPPVLLPLHIVFLELVIDPACSTAFEAEAEEANIMRRPPRRQQDKLFNRGMLLSSLGEGIAVLTTVFTVYLISVAYAQHPQETSRTYAFATLVLSNLWLILVNRSRTRTAFAMLPEKNSALWWVVGGTVSGLVLVMFNRHLRELFRFAEVEWTWLALCLTASLLSVTGFEVIKLRRRSQR